MFLASGFLFFFVGLRTDDGRWGGVQCRYSRCVAAVGAGVVLCETE